MVERTVVGSPEVITAKVNIVMAANLQKVSVGSRFGLNKMVIVILRHMLFEEADKQLITVTAKRMTGAEIVFLEPVTIEYGYSQGYLLAIILQTAKKNIQSVQLYKQGGDVNHCNQNAICIDLLFYHVHLDNIAGLADRLRGERDEKSTDNGGNWFHRPAYG